MWLIDAEEFDGLFENQIALGNDPYHAAMDALQDATAVDAEPVRHSEWIPVDEPYRVHDVVLQNYKCRDCKESMATRPDNLTNYCPNCGAKMDLSNENRTD